jgi:hypothetical protein
MAPPTPLQVETKYQEIRESNPDRVTEVVVTYTYPEPSGFAEARMVFEADEHFLLVDGQVVSVLDLFRGMQVRMADGTIGTIIGNPERRYEIPIPPLPTENGLWNSRVVGRVRHTADEMVEFRWAGQMVRVTPGHVVWSVTRQGWVGAQELFQGELIRVAGSLVAPVEGAKRITGRVEVFGIEVEYFHNYFVGTGDNAMLVHNGPDCVVKPVDPLEAWENEGGALSPSAVKEAKLARLFADVEPVEVTGRVNLEGRTPQEIGQMLPRFTTIQQEGSNPAFGLLVDNRTGRVFALRSGLSPQVQETVNGIPYKTGTMTRATAEAAGGIWGDPRRPLGAHIEGQAAAFMRAKGITDATLYINGTTPCLGPRGCFNNLPTLLAERSTLTVFNKRGRQFSTFTGLPD